MGARRGNSGRNVRTRLHDDRRIEDFRKIRKGRRPSFSIGDTIRSRPHCFEGPPDRADVITILRRNMKFLGELRIREDPFA
jgi:hypothetical protein